MADKKLKPLELERLVEFFTLLMEIELGLESANV